MTAELENEVSVDSTIEEESSGDGQDLTDASADVPQIMVEQNVSTGQNETGTSESETERPEFLQPDPEIQNVYSNVLQHQIQMPFRAPPAMTAATSELPESEFDELAVIENLSVGDGYKPFTPSAIGQINMGLEADYDHIDRPNMRRLSFNPAGQAGTGSQFSERSQESGLPKRLTSKQKHKQAEQNDKEKIRKIVQITKNSKMFFYDFLDMLSVFSSRAPEEVKAYYAFQIFDFSEDNCITSYDIKSLIAFLTNIKNDGDLEDLEEKETENQSNFENPPSVTHHAPDSEGEIYQVSNGPRNTQLTQARKTDRKTKKQKLKAEGFIRSVTRAILEEASHVHHRDANSGIQIQDFQKILLQNEEFKHNFSFSL